MWATPLVPSDPREPACPHRAARPLRADPASQPGPGCGFCEPGQQAQLIADGETELTGRFPVNTDGGLLANGEPVGASGLRQIYEISQQLRGRAGRRQVPGNPKSGFTHVYGGPGISAVTIIQR